ncbi:TonB-dependent receptor [Phenylobacterium sp.]|jgi:TonB-dependent receptor|uniref:TonB-dependent receptor domain-containing protein n=1 Tax=Phenylobacterium sp. TaxID=1871053 RepID=UPI000C952B1E|nr:TonB-dependent receptor [Phenylobacterium sp.]MAK83061.1 TonB-dependent receptor [Phenylobacterium sp.]|tara:strand:- start:4140 stop:6731 length:2592 start_codon:yes stop_codon:yes gene_type:complete
MNILLRPLSGLLLCTTALMAPAVVFAQAADGPEVQELVVRGRYIPEVMRETAEVASIVTAEDLVRQGDGTAAEALTRLTGLSVVSGRFVYVRGLGERYSSALLNGSPLPSPEPLQRVVPLDLFPSGILASVNVQKSYSVNYPGEFGGGVIDLRSIGVPDEPFVSMSFSLSGDDETSLKQGLTYYGGDYDLTGFDDNTRDLPGLIRQGIATGQRIDQSNFDAETLVQMGRSFQNANVRLLQSTNDIPINGSVGLSAGTRWNQDWGSLGVVAVGGYDRGWTTQRAIQQAGVVSLGGLSVTEDLRSNTTEMDVEWHGLASVALDLDAHKFQWTNFYVRNVTKEARSVEGESSAASNYIRDDYTAWYERELFNTQLTGAHEFGDLEIDWRGSYANTTREAPYETQIRYRRLADNRFYHNPQSDANFLRFSDLEDTTYGAGVDVRYRWDNPLIVDLTVSAGYAYYENERDSVSRAFRFTMDQTPSLAFQLQRVDYLYSNFNIRTDGLFLREVTGSEGAAAYQASLTTNAFYVQGEGEILPAVRASLGLRYEDGEQSVQALDLFSANDPAAVELKNDYVLPAGTVTWNFADDQQLRFGISKTIARPQFREQAPQIYLDPESDRTFVGNPYLVDSELVNIDLRYERYFDRNQFATLGAFYKDIDKPIESVVNETGSGLQQTFLNAPRAVLYGAEAEFKKYFEPQLGVAFLDNQRWLIGANYTWTKAEVQADAGDQVFPLTGLGQPAPATSFVIDGSRLQGTSEHIANLQFGFESLTGDTQATLLANYASERTVARGSAGGSDFLQEPGVQLDLTVRQKFQLWGPEFTLGFEARNLLGEEFDEFQTLGGDKIILNNYELGRSYSVSLSASF